MTDPIRAAFERAKAQIGKREGASTAEGWEAPDVPLPDTVRIGHIRFGKGVSLRTLVSAAARWHARACEAFQAKLEHRAAREAAVGGLCSRASICRDFDGLCGGCERHAARAIAAFLRTPGLSAALHDLMQRPENAGRPWAEVLAEAVEREGER